MEIYGGGCIGWGLRNLGKACDTSKHKKPDHNNATKTMIIIADCNIVETLRFDAIL